MGARKVQISKDWWKAKSSDGALTKMDKVECIKSEDLPQLMTKEEVAELLRCSLKTVERLWQTKRLLSVKVGGRRFSTPSFVGMYLESEIRKNG